ncbi:pyruvate dehydrogenase complex dihydrolipoamide acetyltransferase [Neorickettsia sp. 179522]|uniref:pyruvate dehydrogenase complex dihydrolipoamide acetyltransferase n=1 Tax=Neorickettsia sp. 179522 TaxID=1714371 RepID=UPI0007963462|nr:pyruvate dehydrogenase complex dihydrolipoamide acetyltransferase [Neorickettsia sp. 179522]KYH12854.1 dihydrolipoamide acetyltransferase [Neorickettsia sp. 179522]
MPVKILMPALSPTMKEGTLAKWLVSEGAKVEAGQVIAEIETDKATMEFEAVDEGVLGKILIPAKTAGVKVNEPIAVLLDDGEGEKELEEFLSAIDKPTVTDDQPKTPNEDKIENNLASPPDGRQQDRIVATPLARKIASINSIDLSLVGSGSGPNGRIVKNDLLKLLDNRPQAEMRGHCTETSIPVSPMRRVIAQRLVESKQNVPHFYLSVTCYLQHLLSAKKKFDDCLETRVTVNDFVIKACAFALHENPAMNVSWEGDFIRQNQTIDISVAVAIPDGLITPIIFSADKLSLASISDKVKELVGKAKMGTLQPREFQGGSFTVSNLGMYGIDEFTAIINPPQAAILAVGAARKVPTVFGDEIVVSDVVTLTLSCDHRVVDGALAAKFMQSIKKAIENPVIML